MTICPFCKASFAKGEPVVACLQCSTPHHSICWIENGNHCTVYRCDGFQEVVRSKYSANRIIPKTKLISALAIFLITINYIFHFFIPELKPFLKAIASHDLARVFTVETAVILSSAILLLFSRHYSGFTYKQDLVRFFASLVLITNLLFVLGLLYYGLTAGWQSLSSAIYF